MGYTLTLPSPWGIILAVYFSVLFVGLLYVWRLVPPWKHMPNYGRDDPIIIRQRAISTLSTCIIAVTSLYFCSSSSDGGESFARFMGMHLDIRPVISCLGVVMILFLGPLLEIMFFETSYRDFRCTWQNARNYIVSPIVEEIVFRGCVAKALLAEGYTFTPIVNAGPLLFSAAHAHQYFALIRGKGIWWDSSSFCTVFLQIVYTYVYGMLSMYLLLRTGSLFAVILTHTFCNIMCLPSFSFLTFKTRDDVILCIAHIAGIVLFFSTLSPLTEGFDSSYAF